MKLAQLISAKHNAFQAGLVSCVIDVAVVIKAVAKLKPSVCAARYMWRAHSVSGWRLG